MDMALLFFALVWGLLGGRRSGGATGTWTPLPEEVTAPQVPRGGWYGGTLEQTSYTPAWPAVVPSSLPRFPGPSWEFDEPPPAAVQRRAGELVGPLWARGGKGSHRTEQTGGRWITYQAQVMASGRNGVVAYRMKRTRPRPLPSAPSVPMVTPGSTEASHTPPWLLPASSQTPATVLRMPTLRMGDGMKPAAPRNDVAAAQRRLGISDDGRFGPGTRAAVVALQRQRGLQPDGVVGPLTWNALLNPLPATVRA